MFCLFKAKSHQLQAASESPNRGLGPGLFLEQELEAASERVASPPPSWGRGVGTKRGLAARQDRFDGEKAVFRAKRGFCRPDVQAGRQAGLGRSQF